MHSQNNFLLQINQSTERHERPKNIYLSIGFKKIEICKYILFFYYMLCKTHWVRNKAGLGRYYSSAKLN